MVLLCFWTRPSRLLPPIWTPPVTVAQVHMALFHIKKPQLESVLGHTCLSISSFCWHIVWARFWWKSPNKAVYEFCETFSICFPKPTSKGLEKGKKMLRFIFPRRPVPGKRAPYVPQKYLTTAREENKPLGFLPDVTFVYNQPVYDESLCCFST